MSNRAPPDSKADREAVAGVGLNFPRWAASAASSLASDPLRLGLLAMGCLAAGFVLGALVGGDRMSGRARVAGACIALEMTAAHGLLDDVQRRKVVCALTSALNPHQESFPISYREMAWRCATILGADARPHRDVIATSPNDAGQK